jgi:hypothetical protein
MGVSSGPPWRRAVGILATLVACLAVASTVFGDRSGVDPRLLLFSIGALVCVVPVRRLVAALPIDARRAPALLGRTEAAAPATSPGFTSWLGRVNGGTTSARAATLRLVPALRDVARQRLFDRRGISFDHAPAAAAAALGPTAWDLLRPDAPRSTEATRPGVPLDQLAVTVRALEEL